MKILKSVKVICILSITFALVVLTLLINYSYDDDWDLEDMISYMDMVAPDMKLVHAQYGIRTIDERLYLTEKEMVEHGIQYDVNKCACPQLSKIYILNEKQTFSVGDEIRVSIDMYDGNGLRRTIGGDFLRIWLENKMARATVSGHVIDHNNGSYTGVLRTQWEGRANIRCFLERRREQIAFMYGTFKEQAVLGTIIGEFTSDIVTELTQCSMNPDKFIKYCNFTNMNSGFPWYCEHPHNSGLKCSSFMFSLSDIGVPLRDPQQEKLYYLSNNKKKDYFPRKLTITAVDNYDGDSVVRRPEVPTCSELSPKATWQRVSPTGVFYGGQFIPAICRDELPMTGTAYRMCLRNRMLRLDGDSTSHQFKNSIHEILGIPEGNLNHIRETLFDKRDNFSVSWGPHEFPFFHGTYRTSPKANIAWHVILDGIGDDSRDIIVLYLHVHFNLAHPDVYRSHMRRLVESVKRLLARAPGVTIAVRGPHAYFRNQLLALISYWGLLYMDILREEFASVADKVIYIDYWDLTMAVGSDVHPSKPTVKIMVHYMMSILCHRA